MFAFLLLPTPSTRAGQPFSICAVPSITADGVTLLLDPAGESAVALLSDPGLRLSLGPDPRVLQTEWTNPGGAGLPRLALADAAPEFWVQPASWRPFLKGPGSYSGAGSEMLPRHWAGMPFTDRRAHRLDPGLKPAVVTGAPGGGSIRARTVAGALVVAWSGVAGRVYRLLHTSDLARPFEPVQTFIAAETGEMQVTFSTAGAQGFYRLAEVFP